MAASLNPLSKNARAQRKCKACLESVSIFGEQGIALTPERAAHIARLAQQQLGQQQEDQQQHNNAQQPQANEQRNTSRAPQQQGQQQQQQQQAWAPLWPPPAQQQGQQQQQQPQQGQQQQAWAPLWPPPQQQQQQQQPEKQQPEKQPPENPLQRPLQLHIKAVNASEQLMARLTAAGLKHLIKHTASCPTTATSIPSSASSSSFSAIASRIKSFSASSGGSATASSPAPSGPAAASHTAAAAATSDSADLTNTAEATTSSSCSSNKDAAGSSIPLEHAPAVLEAASLPEGCNLVVIEVPFYATGLAEAEAVVAALALLGCVPAVFVAAAPCRALTAAAASPAGRLWGVCDSYAALEQRLAGDLPRVASLRQRLLEEISGLLAPFKAVNQVQHFAKRAPLAFVPFGVHTVNALGLVRLAKSVLRVTGMGDSKQAKRAVATQAAVGGAKVTAINTLSDAYQLIVQGSIISEAMSAAAGAASVAAAGAAAADTITLLDAFTLGTVCVFTGVVSAVGAAMCRPAMVDGMGRVVAAQQLAVAVRPGLCVLAAGVAADDDGSSGGGGDQVAQQDSCVKRRTEKE